MNFLREAFVTLGAIWLGLGLLWVAIYLIQFLRALIGGRP